MINWEKDKNDILKTTLLCLTLMVTGCGVSLLGATLIDLEISANTTKTQSSFIIAARAIGYATGSILGGFFGDHIPIIYIPISSLLIIGLANAFLPWMRSFWTLLPWLALSGFGLGNLEVSANLWLINIWTNKWPPMIYSTSFSYGFGTLLAPLLAHPFLLPFNNAPSTTPPPLPPTSTRNTNESRCEACEHPEDMSLHYAFETFAIICLFLDVLYITLLLSDKSTQRETISESPSTDCESAPKSSLPFTPKIILKILILLLSHSGAGLNMGFGLLLQSYSVKSDLQFTKSQGSLLSSAYWTIYTFGRLLAFILMTCISNRSLMLVHLTLTLIAGICLYLTYPLTLGLGLSVLLMGIGLSPFTPLVFFNVKTHMRLSGHLTSIVIVGTIIGESIYPPLIAHTLTASANPLAFPFICIMLSVSSVFYFICFDLVGQRYHLHHHHQPRVKTIVDQRQLKLLLLDETEPHKAQIFNSN